MRVLLDECLPRRLKGHFGEHQVITVPEAGWSGKKNGELLRAAAGLIEVFVTVDSNLAYQQHMQGLSFVVVVLSARSNRLQDLMPLLPQVLSAIASAQPGEVVHVGEK
jgi:predicted nuclease of predicted toxin-antitoxin system